MFVVYTPSICFRMFVDSASGVGILCTTPPLLRCPSMRQGRLVWLRGRFPVCGQRIAAISGGWV